MKSFQKLAVLGAGALALINVSAVMPAVFSVSAAAEQGTWEFDETTGTLTISGAWQNFYTEISSAPWEKLGNNTETPVLSVVFGENTKSIPVNALCGFKSLKSVTIPAGTETIGNYAFMNCTALEQVTLPDSLTEIGNSAFFGCTALKSVAVPEKVTLIGGGAFRGCTALKEITLPEKLTEIGSFVFQDTAWLADRRAENPLVIVNGIVIDGFTCKGVVQIPDGVTEIAYSAFEKNPEMTELVIADSVQKLGFRAFSECEALEKVVIPKQITSVTDYAFFNCDNLEHVVMEEGVTAICAGAFSSCDRLADIVIPETVNRIETYALRTTPWMEKQQKENPLVIINHILVDGTCCKGDVVIPEDVVWLSPYVFYSFDECHIRSVVIPDGITEIPYCAFNQCKELTSVTIPDTVERIDNSAFADCIQLREITIPSSVRELGCSAVEGCPIKSVVIPDGITEIPYCAFNQCQELTSVTIPDTVEHIDARAFSDCTQLREITIPSSVREFGHSVFSGTDLTIKGYTGSAAEAYAEEYEIPFVAIGSAVPGQTEPRCGDANTDGSFDIADAVLASRYIVADADAVLTDAGRLNADVTGDGAIQPDDVTMMLQRIAKKIQVFPAEEKKSTE